MGFLAVSKPFMHFPTPSRFFLDFDEYRIVDPSMIGYIKTHNSHYQLLQLQIQLHCVQKVG
jgi:hypothetical protein